MPKGKIFRKRRCRKNPYEALKRCNELIFPFVTNGFTESTAGVLESEEEVKVLNGIGNNGEPVLCGTLDSAEPTEGVLELKEKVGYISILNRIGNNGEPVLCGTLDSESIVQKVVDRDVLSRSEDCAKSVRRILCDEKYKSVDNPNPVKKFDSLDSAARVFAIDGFIGRHAGIKDYDRAMYLCGKCMMEINSRY